MKKIISLCLVICASLNLIAQNDAIDKLKNKLSRTTHNDSVKVDLLTELASSYFKTNLDSVSFFTNKALTLSESINYKQGIAKSFKLIGICNYYKFNYSESIKFYIKSLNLYQEIGLSNEASKCLYNIGLCYWKQNNYEQALVYYNQSLELFKKLGNENIQAECLNNIGLIYKSLSEFNIALDYFYDSLTIFEKVNNKAGKARCLFNIGQIYLQRGNSSYALNYCNKSLLLLEQLGDKMRIAQRYNFIGLVYFKQSNYPLAIEHYSKSLQVSQDLEDKEGIASCLNNLGLAHWKGGEIDTAMVNCKLALNIFEEIKFRGGVADALLNLGLMHLDKQKDELALDHLFKALDISETIQDEERKSYILSGISNVYRFRNEHRKALNYSDQSLLIADNLGLLIIQRDVREQLSDIYAALKNYNKAYENYILFKVLNDSVFNKDNIKRMAMLEYQYELDKTKQAMVLEQHKNDVVATEKSKRERFLSSTLILGFILMTGFAVVTFRSYLQKRKANLLLAIQKERIENVNKVLTVKKQKIQSIAKDLSIANRTKDKFFSIIAHDLRSPIGNIMSFGELLGEENDEIDEGKKKMFIEIIANESKMTFSLLDNLLLWAGSNTGRISVHKEEIIINDIVSENINFFRAIANTKELNLKNSLNEKICVIADCQMINTVVRNLISNAIKFTPTNGTIEIISKKTSNNRIDIGISDSGVGIEKEILSKLFNNNSKITTLGTNNEKGSGLGLKLCKEFIEKNEGTIKVDSELDIGTTFWFSLPTSKQLL